MDISQAQFQAADLCLGKGTLGISHAAEAALQVKQLLLNTGDFLGRCFGNAIDQGMDGGGRRALAGHHQRGLAGKGCIEHGAAETLVGRALQTKRINGGTGGGGLARTGIAEQAKHLLARAAIVIPIHNRPDGSLLLR